MLNFLTYLINIILLAVITASVTKRSFKVRNLPLRLYSVTFASLFIAILMYFLNDYFLTININVYGSVVDLLVFLPSFFLFLGAVCWYFAIQFSRYDILPFRTNIISMLMFGAFLGGFFVTEPGLEIIYRPILLATIAIFAIEVTGYLLYILKTRREDKLPIKLYTLGFVSLMVGSFIGFTLYWIRLLTRLKLPKTLWLVPFGIGLALIAFVIVKYPRSLIITESVPYYLIFLSSSTGQTLFAYDFGNLAKSDLELISSALSGIIAILREILLSSRELSGIDHGDRRVIFCYGLKVIGILVSNKDSKMLRDSLKSALDSFEKKFSDLIGTEKEVVISQFNKFIEEVPKHFIM